MKLRSLIVLLIAAAGPPPAAAYADSCADAYAEFKLPPLREPQAVGRPGRICTDGSLFDAALAQGLKFVPLEQHPELNRNLSAVVELVSSKRRIVHITRKGVYYSEFLDQTLTDEGGHLSTTSLRLAESPKGPLEDLNVRDLRYIYMTEEYVWGPLRVEEVRRKHRLVAMKSDGSLHPLEEWQESTARRRLAYISLVDERPGGGNEMSTIQTYYDDPVFKSEVFFRRFELRMPKQLTVLQFISTAPDSAGYAYAEIVQNGEVLRRIRISDPGNDNFEVTIRLTQGKPPPVY